MKGAMRGRLLDLSISLSGKQRLTVEIEGDFTARYDELNGKEVSVSIKAYHGKRNLDQNALYWMNLTRLAKAIGTSNPELHNLLLRRYGEPEYYDDKLVYVTILDTDEAERKANQSETFHVKPTSHTLDGKHGETYRYYILLRGSSTYDKAEMSRLISGLQSECEQAGVVFLSDETYKFEQLESDT